MLAVRHPRAEGFVRVGRPKLPARAHVGPNRRGPGVGPPPLGSVGAPSPAGNTALTGRRKGRGPDQGRIRVDFSSLRSEGRRLLRPGHRQSLPPARRRRSRAPRTDRNQGRRAAA